MPVLPSDVYYINEWMRVLWMCVYAVFVVFECARMNAAWMNECSGFSNNLIDVVNKW